MPAVAARDEGSEAPAELLEWDSAFWGVTIGRVRGRFLDEECLARVDSWAAAHEVDCLYFLAAPDDPGTVRVARNAGFVLVDVRLELRRSAQDELPDVAAVRPYRPADLPWLSAIARTRHEGTRFYADAHFPRSRCADLYETWLVRSCEEGFADCVLVAEEGRQAVGYVTVHLDPGARQGSIGLIAVARDVEGRGHATQLVTGAVAWCRLHGAESVSVATQRANDAAKQLYRRLGFRMSSTGLWFHRWYER